MSPATTPRMVKGSISRCVVRGLQLDSYSATSELFSSFTSAGEGMGEVAAVQGELRDVVNGCSKVKGSSQVHRGLRQLRTRIPHKYTPRYSSRPAVRKELKVHLPALSSCRQAGGRSTAAVGSMLSMPIQA